MPTLREGLQKLGYQEGKNIQLDWRNLPDEAAANATAKEFVNAQMDLIVAFENQTVRATKAATSRIPVVFLHVTDPVAEGFVQSLSHPGGNMTGFVSFAASPGKQLELFTEIIPKLRRVITLVDPQDPATGQLMSDVREAAAALKLQLIEREVPDQTAIERFFDSVRRGETEGIFPVSRNLLGKFPALLTQLSLEKRLPLAMHRKSGWNKAHSSLTDPILPR
ncbi:MAG: ABC transporter substrate-binding protein [Candidatus Binatia bacterium]